MTAGEGAVRIKSRRLPNDAVGVADARILPDDDFARDWESIILPQGIKEVLARGAASSMLLRSQIPFVRLPLHGIVLLVGPPGVGKTTLARGLADRVARMMRSMGQFVYVELDPHRLTSSALGRSQREVEAMFSETLAELAATGPLVVLIDEVETLATDRAQMSFETQPADVHRAVDAALVGLDRLARDYPHITVIATSNFPQAIDGALASRADRIYEVPMPVAAARREILEDTIQALADRYEGAKRLLVDGCLDEAAKVSDGLDGRRLRKAVAAACARHDDTTIDPGKLRVEDLLSALCEAGGRL